MIGRRTQLAALLAAAASIALMWLPQIPLGISGEWTWARIPLDSLDWLDISLGCATAAAVMVVYVAVCGYGRSRLPRAGRSETAVWLVALVAVAFVVVLVLQLSPPPPYDLSKGTWVTYYPRSSGYFFHARYHVADLSSFLADYERWMAEGDDVLHIGTHPPGLFLFHRGLIAACESLPALTDLLLHTQPASVTASFDAIQQSTLRGNTPLMPEDRAAIWLAMLLTQLLGVATVVPLYLLARQYSSTSAAWAAVAFWPLVPALAVFLPKSDVLYAFFGTLFLWLWLSGWQRASLLRTAAAGLVFWIGVMGSLALLPVAALAAVVTLYEFLVGAPIREGDEDVRVKKRSISRLAVSVGIALLAFAAATAAFWAVFETNLLAVWLWNYRNHAAFYDQYARTYWKWLLVNPLELLLAAGAPLVVLSIGAAGRVARGGNARRALAPYVGFAIVWGLLWLSGKNMGEAARLWLFLMPWLVWLAAPAFDAIPDADGGTASRPAFRVRSWLLLLLLQWIVCLATVMRIDGFHLSEF